MMKRLSADLKRMLNALALQDAAEYLPTRDKIQALGVDLGSPGSSSGTPDLPPPPPRRVALLSDGGDIEGMLRYTLDACERQQATLDLVLYGKGREGVAKLRARLQRQQIAHEVIVLGEESVDALAEYLCVRRTLVYLVAPTDDPLALQLTEEVVPSRGGRMHLPMVLIDRNQHSRINRINAA